MEKEKLEELLDLLCKSAKTKITFLNGWCYDNCFANSQSFYFRYSVNHPMAPYFERFFLDSERGALLDFLKDTKIVERMIDGVYYPIWTREDGVLRDPDKKVFIKGRYYTIAELEDIISIYEKHMMN